TKKTARCPHNLLRACLKNGLLVAQAIRLCRPATRRPEGEGQFEPLVTPFSQRYSPQVRSASRRPGRAGRPRHPFSKQALRRRWPEKGAKKLSICAFC